MRTMGSRMACALAVLFLVLFVQCESANDNGGPNNPRPGTAAKVHDPCVETRLDGRGQNTDDALFGRIGSCVSAALTAETMYDGLRSLLLGRQVWVWFWHGAKVLFGMTVCKCGACGMGRLFWSDGRRRVGCVRGGRDARIDGITRVYDFTRAAVRVVLIRFFGNAAESAAEQRSNRPEDGTRNGAT